MLRNFFIFFAIVATFISSSVFEVAAEESGYAPQTTDERGLKVTVVLKNFPAAAKTMDFDVTMETHTQALNDDLVKSSSLVADGKQYFPIAWTGAPPGGHHRKGVLHFKAVAPRPQSVLLQIHLADENAARSFTWTLNGK